MSELTFSDGTSVATPANGMILFVGPNNGGKSRALSDILGHAEAAIWNRGIVATEVKFDREGDAGSIRSWALENWATTRDGEAFVRIPGGDDVRFDQFAKFLTLSTGLGYAASTLVMHAETHSRLGLAEASMALDLRSGSPRSALQHAAVNPDLERKFSRYCEEAFGVELIVDRFAGQMLRAVVGQRPEFDHDRGMPTRAYLDALAVLPPLEAQGDGLRAYLGLIMQAVASPQQVLLIDEPEAFLHPPKARALGRILAEESTSRQIFAATHSIDFLQGALDANAAITVIRLTRHGHMNDARVLAREDLREFWSNPLLRSSNILDGIFHDAVVLCEGDSDCRYYSLVRDRLNIESLNRPDLHFTQCGGKGRLGLAAKSLRAVGVPVIAVPDLDIFRSREVAKGLHEAMGGNWEDVHALQQTVHHALAKLFATPLRGEVAKAISQILDVGGATDSDAPLTKKQAEAIRNAVKSEHWWKRAKTIGLATLDEATAHAAQRLIDASETLGIFVVPVGELERFEPDFNGHANEWLEDALPKVTRDGPSPDARSFLTKIENYARERTQTLGFTTRNQPPDA